MLTFPVIIFCITAYLITQGRPIHGQQKFNLKGKIEKGYYIEIEVGTPPQKLNFILDTGSSNVAVASCNNELINKFYNATNSTTRQQDEYTKSVSITYTDGFWQGQLFTDVIRIPAAGVSVNVRTQIVEIQTFKNFFIKDAEWEGIFGMGFPEIAQPNSNVITTVIADIMTQTSLQDIFSMELCNNGFENFSEDTYGELHIGAYLNITDEIIFYTPIVKEWYYEVVITAIAIGDTLMDMPCLLFNDDKTIVDSGTTNLKFPTNVHNKVVEKIKEHIPSKLLQTDYNKFWSGDDILCWNKNNSFSIFPNLLIYLPSVNHNETIQLKVMPQHYLLYSKNTTREKEGRVCFKFGISPSTTGAVLGTVILEHYNVIFNRMNHTIGFQKSSCKNISVVKMDGFINETSCKINNTKKSSSLQIISYIVLGLFIFLMAPICILLCIFYLRTSKTNESDDESNLIYNDL